MVKKDTMSLSSLNMDELAGVVSIYPWYAGARVELCRRMAKLPDASWTKEKYAEQALFVENRKLIYDILKYTPKKAAPAKAPKAPKAPQQVYVIGGDYFSAEQYAAAKREDDDIFTSFLVNAIEKGNEINYTPVETSTNEICTEEMAKIYLDQGFPAEAKEIYSKLSLRYPEKSVYFAALIDKIDKQI